MKKVYFEIIGSIAAVLLPTYFVYQNLVDKSGFWNAETLWSGALILCWLIVASGYYHQGWLVHKEGARGVSAALPIAVFFVQCILFVKGIYYQDASLVIGALMVNSGVLFSLYNIWRAPKG